MGRPTTLYDLDVIISVGYGSSPGAGAAAATDWQERMIGRQVARRIIAKRGCVNAGKRFPNRRENRRRMET